MTQNILMWSLTIVFLFLIFAVRGIQKFRNEGVHHPIIEWDNEEDIHYETEDDSDAI